MSFNVDNKWVWDFWFAKDNNTYHMFFLQADKSHHPDQRHWNVSVGHAKSTDLHNWTLLPDAISPSPEMDENEPADSLTTWTGCVIQTNNQWLMFYTGGKKSEKGLIQRVCLATSSDLIHWEKHPSSPLIGVDDNWYDKLNLDYWHDESWRDPWVFKDREADLYHMLITCRANQGQPEGRGAIGYASSRDLIHWQAGPPIVAPGLFGEMEVPQIACIGGKYYLFCSVSAKYHVNDINKDGQPAQTGLIYFMGDSPTGPFNQDTFGYLGEDTIGRLYAGRVIQGPDDNWYFMAFENMDENGNFVGGICSPKRIKQDPQGKLHIVESTETTFVV